MNSNFSYELHNSAEYSLEKGTHVAFDGDCPAYVFNNNSSKSSFYLSYVLRLHESLVEDEDAEPLAIGEIPGKLVPVIYSFNSLIPVIEDGGIDTELLIGMAKILQNITRRLGDLQGNVVFENNQLTCAILSRVNEPDHLGNMCMDVLFHFPYAIETKESIYNAYGFVEKELGKKSGLTGINIKGSLDNSFYENAHPLYGSSEGQSFEAYRYIGALSVSQISDLFQESCEILFPVMESSLVNAGIITAEDIKEMNKNNNPLRDDFWLPIILSLSDHQTKSSRRAHQSEKRKHVHVPFKIGEFSNELGNYKEIEEEEKLLSSLCETFIRMWNPWRIDQISEWQLIGECLFNIYEGGPKGIQRWIELTNILVGERADTLREFGLDEEGNIIKSAEKDEEDDIFGDERECLGLKFEEEEKEKEDNIRYKIYCREEFQVPRLIDITDREKQLKDKRKKTAVPHYLMKNPISIYRKYYYAFPSWRQTIKSLADNAREDSPADFDKWHSGWYRSAARKAACTGYDSDLARALSCFLFLDWVCETQGDNKIDWYYIFNNRCCRDKGHQRLNKIIISSFVDIFERMDYDLAAEQNTGGRNKEAYTQISGSIQDIIKKLKSQQYKPRLVKEAAIFFNVPGVSSYFNENCQLMCVNTGVLVAGTEGIIFRKGRLEDFVTKKSAAFYLDHLSWDDPGVKMVMKWTKQTFLKNQDMMNWWWKFFASCLRGGNDDKIFPFIWGEKGNEGKSAWVRLFEAVFGDYCSHVEPTYFTMSAKDPNGATPVTSSIVTAHLTFVEEIENGQTFRGGDFKKRTGKDKIWTRGLFQEGGPRTVQTTFVSVTNDLPEISGGGEAAEERVAVVPIRSRRTFDAPENKEEQYRTKKFKRDNFFDQEIEYLGVAALWILVQFYGKYVKEGLRPYPQDIVKHTKRYWEDKNKYHRFTNEKIQVTGKDEDVMDVDEIYELFKEWHEKSYPKIRIPNVDSLRKDLRNRWGKMKNGKFLGVAPIKKKKKRNVIIRPAEDDVEEAF